jgi:uncharacterized protein
MKALYFALFVSASILLTACGSTPKQATTSPSIATMDKVSSPETLISQALKAETEHEQSLYFFQAALSYWQSNLYAQSDAALLEINPAELSPDRLRQYLSMSLTLAINSKNSERIQSILPLIPGQGLHQSSIPEQVQFALSLAQAYELIEQPINAAITLIEHRGLFETSEQATLDENIWRLLRTSETSSLSQYNYQGGDIDAIAWLDLARVIQLNQISLDAQYDALQMWLQAWPEHPATISPPHELEILQKLPSTRPDSITLALPLSGPISTAGKAIRDGFMAQYYANQANNDLTLDIHFFDTAKNDIRTLYENSSENANNLIIGPLDKKSLHSLSSLDQIETPTLALNYLDADSPAPELLYQLGLAPEAEAEQLAQRLSKKGLNKVGLILPENNLGFRIYDTFLSSFSSLDGIIIESVFYKDQASLASSVARLLGTGESLNRKRQIQKISQTKLEFLPRRRQDIDALVMVAKPEIARQLKPLFAYHYAADLPVFASSHIHSENINSNNRDLDNIEFIDMPWMLSNTINIKSTINKALPASRDQYNRFYALGADSFRVAPRLQLLKEVQGSQMQGHTGLLSMNNKGRIHREMEWARFKKGRAIIIKE